ELGGKTERTHAMHRLINMKKGPPAFLVALVLVSIALSFSTEAALPPPPPDGGYPGFTTAEGTGALFNLTSGIENTGLGFEALNMNTTGNFNTRSEEHTSELQSRVDLVCRLLLEKKKK